MPTLEQVQAQLAALQMRVADMNPTALAAYYEELHPDERHELCEVLASAARWLRPLQPVTP